MNIQFNCRFCKNLIVLYKKIFSVTWHGNILSRIAYSVQFKKSRTCALRQKLELPR